MGKTLDKIKEFLKPDWRGLYQSVLQNLLWVGISTIGLIVVGFWLWIHSLDPLEFRARMSQAFDALLYFFMAVGMGTILYAFWSLWLRIRPTPTLLFSYHLDRITKDKSISGLGLSFIREIKKSPPFLGIHVKNPIISSTHEKVLAVYYRAVDFENKNRKIIRGGHPAEDEDVEQGDTWDTIAKRIYGDSKFAKNLKDENKPLQNPNKGIWLPFIDISGTLKMTPNSIRDIFFTAYRWDDETKETVRLLADQLNLTKGEMWDLLDSTYDAARATLSKVRGKK